MTASRITNALVGHYPWTSPPLIISAPMRVMSGPALALAVSEAGGLGFIGPGIKPDSILTDLSEAASLFSERGSAALKPLVEDKGVLPIGIGFQLWNGDLTSAKKAVEKFTPAAIWLFAPKDGQRDIDEWTEGLREVTKGKSQIWLQIGTLTEAVEAAGSTRGRPDVLVVQGQEAGGHGRTSDGASLGTLVPEIKDVLEEKDAGDIPLVAAGGIADGRGVAAALCLGASGVAMGTRFLCSNEARIKKGYQDAVLEAADGGKNTVRTHLYNHLRGTFGWPEEKWAPRTIINKSWEEHTQGVDFEQLREKHDQSVKEDGDKAWGKQGGRTATYAGTGVGLVRSVDPAGKIVKDAREETTKILKRLQSMV
ncbi:putative 2-nitropropane dioxygenase precursor [Triangularia verruculosa]|uniref:2-nitropropane dioxygenase n=1 Tax=Triangularia verruculosa TaxID=2587418 RepID=A0AAN6XM44_9PEZI|nr:putative 2-nitropropane dioxygenase precursor [Triangularia verruculosa]